VLSNDNVTVVRNAKEYYLAHFSSKTILPKWEELYSRIINS
jgi:hypothetical protein